MIKKIIYVLILFLVSSCIQEEETPDKLVRGYYKYSENEGVELLNDSTLVMKLKINKKFQYDTINFIYIPPVLNAEFVNVGNLYIKTKMNLKSKLVDYCKKMNLDEEHLIYTLRYGKYMLLPNPESTEFSYELVLTSH